MKTIKSDRKGFTLVEVLATVAIISVISAIGFIVYLNTIKNSKNKSINLAMNNLRTAAELYVKESFNNITFNTYNETEQYACVTVLELVNAGYFKKDFYNTELYKKNNINNNTYISIIRNNNNKSDLEISVLDKKINTSDKCQTSTLNQIINTETTFNFSIKELTGYTDTAYLQFKPLPNNKSINKCSVSKKDIGTWTDFPASSDNTCIISGLEGDESDKDGEKKDGKYGGIYIIKACILTNKDDNCGDNKETDDNNSFKAEVNLSDFIAPTIEFFPNSSVQFASSRQVKINYNNTGIYNKEGDYYFKSDVNGQIENKNQNIYECSEASIKNIKYGSCKTPVSTFEKDGTNYIKIKQGVIYNIGAPKSTTTNTSTDTNTNTNTNDDNEPTDPVEEDVDDGGDEVDENTEDEKETDGGDGLSDIESGGEDDTDPEGTTTTETTESNEDEEVEEEVNDQEEQNNEGESTEAETNQTDNSDKEEITNEINFSIVENVSGGKKVYAYIKDKTGNYKEANKEIPIIDTSLPKCEIVLTGTKGNNGYYKSNVTARLNTGNSSFVDTYGITTDSANKKPTNKLSSLEVSGNTSKDGIKVYAYVKAKNGQESICAKNVKIDKTVPSCGITMKKSKKSNMSKSSNYDGSWYSGYVTSYPKCSDTKAGKDNSNKYKESGCTGKYKVTVTPNTSDSKKGTFSVKNRKVAAQGQTKHTWKVSDNAGNTAECSKYIRLDRKNPSCSVAKTNTYNPNGVNVKLTCKDNPTGISKSGVNSKAYLQIGKSSKKLTFNQSKNTAGKKINKYTITVKKLKTAKGKSSSTYKVKVKDNAAHSIKPQINVKKTTQHRYKTRPVYCEECCSVWKYKKVTKKGTCKKTYTSKPVDMQKSEKSCPSKTTISGYSCNLTKSVGSTHDANYNTIYSCYYKCTKKIKESYDCSTTKEVKDGCKKKVTNCDKCGVKGYGSWGKWSGWSLSKCSVTKTKSCDSRTVYY